VHTTDSVITSSHNVLVQASLFWTLSSGHSFIMIKNLDENWLATSVLVLLVLFWATCCQHWKLMLCTCHFSGPDYFITSPIGGKLAINLQHGVGPRKWLGLKGWHLRPGRPNSEARRTKRGGLLRTGCSPAHQLGRLGTGECCKRHKRGLGQSPSDTERFIGL